MKNGERKVDFLGIPIPFILFFLIFIFVIFVIYKLGKKNSEFIKYTKENTFEKYKSKYPHLVQNGRVECNQCGSKDIGIIQRFTPYAGEHDKPVAIAHVCQTCGHTVYYSKFDK